jgi:hypothetical protein
VVACDVTSTYGLASNCIGLQTPWNSMQIAIMPENTQSGPISRKLGKRRRLPCLLCCAAVGDDFSHPVPRLT